ncbi:TIGR03032 family protein [Aliiroseovarius halocynthiae]|uniref:TIGR03032 family protein n=2 Tax=Aliiroseovarius halocynthiae TaxID=985055 RepID=A0A545SKT0_9RHOB|nr:TIGR03032 family protein [Aliiroseovarius halocynthiae]
MRLQKLGLSFAFSSYQSGLLYFVGSKQDDGINIHQTALPKPMGISLSRDGSLALSCAFQLMRFENALAPNERMNGEFDACFVPREIKITGRLDAHDVGHEADGGTIFVNTRYNCLARTSPRHSFEEVWRPNFISSLVDEDRCHLNGLAMENGKPRYVTAISRSDTIDGWRDRRADGGVVIDVAQNKVVCEGLSMPHSPRMHNGKLWVANSGTGELGEVVFDEGGLGRFVPRAFCPGFLRGIAFHDGFAFVGLSKPRYERFEGLVLEDRLKAADSDAWCGVQIIDLNTGNCVDWLRIDGAVSELYDLEIIEGIRCPMALSPDTPEAANLITLAC